MSPTESQGDLSRPTHIEVDLGQLTANMRAIQGAVGRARVMPIVKANAYGHGIVEVARHWEGLGIRNLGVALLEEGVQLRRVGCQSEILVLGGLTPQQLPLYLQYDLSITAASVEKLEYIEAAAQQAGRVAKVHLKIDTGMERVGIHWYNADSLLEYALGCQHCEIVGVYSHFANSDSEDISSARTQLDRFLTALQFYERRGLPTPCRHIANSGGILQLPDSYLDLVRPGILSYGIYPSAQVPRTISVESALALRSQVVYFKVVAADTPISYGHTWKTDHPIRVVTLPIGYGDGYPRRLSNVGKVLLRGKRYPIIGRVCMDQLMVNIEWSEAYNGDVVTLLGRDGDDSISVYEMADWLDTIPYEVLTNLNARIPRVYLERSS